jgi:hypothetical protein
LNSDYQYLNQDFGWIMTIKVEKLLHVQKDQMFTSSYPKKELI